MPWSKGQEEFRNLVLKAVPRGMPLTIALCDDHSGVSRIVTALVSHSEKSGRERIVSVFSGFFWNVVNELGERANVHVRGLSGALRKALRALTDDGRYPLTILLQESHLLSVKETELLLLAMEDVIETEGLRVHVVMLQRRTERWSANPMSAIKEERAGCWKSLWPLLPKFLAVRKHFKRIQYFHFDSEAVIQLRGREIPQEIFDEAPKPQQHHAVAS